MSPTNPIPEIRDCISRKFIPLYVLIYPGDPFQDTVNFQWIAREYNSYSLTNLCDWKCKCNNIWSLEYLFRHIKNKTYNLFHLNLRKSQQSSIKFFGDDFEQINVHVRLRISATTCKFSLYYYLSNVHLRTLHFRCNTFSHPCTPICLGYILNYQ